jgi:hypothetical protein
MLIQEDHPLTLWFSPPPPQPPTHTQEKFRHEYWKEAFLPFLAAVGSGLFWGAARYGMGMYGQSVGWDRYHECCSQYINYGRGSEDNQMKMILYETLWPGVWFFLLIGRRIDATLATFLLGLIPEPVRRRFSRGRGILHIWNGDGSLKISALGELCGWVAALGVFPIAASPYLGWASTSGIADGGQEQLPWVLVTFMIMLRFLTHHAVFFFLASTLCAWVAFTIRHTVLAVGGGSLLFVWGEFQSLLVSSSLHRLLVLVCWFRVPLQPLPHFDSAYLGLDSEVLVKGSIQKWTHAPQSDHSRCFALANSLEMVSLLVCAVILNLKP